MNNRKVKPKDSSNGFDISQFELLRDMVLIKALRPVSNTGLVDPAQYEDKPEFGEIVKVGKISDDRLKEGTIVRFGKYSSEVIRTNGQDYFLVHEEDVQAFLPKNLNGKALHPK